MVKKNKIKLKKYPKTFLKKDKKMMLTLRSDGVVRVTQIMPEKAVAEMLVKTKTHELEIFKSNKPLKELKIPHIIDSPFEFGEIQIDEITGWFSGNTEIQNLEIDEGIIGVDDFAFSDSQIQKVIWPTSCKVIPFCCFQNSSIMEISNIEDVEDIKERAFEYTESLNTFKWPDKCKKIPDRCFINSSLSEIKVNKINTVSTKAFFGCQNLKTLDFSNCDIIEFFEDSFDNSGGISLPYYAICAAKSEN